MTGLNDSDDEHTGATIQALLSFLAFVLPVEGLPHSPQI